jgi:hypothetical protein
MAMLDDNQTKSDEVAITERDVVFECPSCAKVLVVDESAEGLIVPCPGCQTNVIVPPKQAVRPSPPPPATATPPAPVAAEEPVAEPSREADLAVVKSRLEALIGKCKEIQTQWTEVNNRLTSRINDINRDFVVVTRLESTQRKVVAELEQVLAQIHESSKKHGATAPAASSAPVAGGRTRVSFRT